MDVYTEIYGIIPATEEYQKMYNAYTACVSAGVESPPKISEYLHLDKIDVPESTGMAIPLEDYYTSEGDANCYDGAEYLLNIKELPPEVATIKIRVGYY